MRQQCRNVLKSTPGSLLHAKEVEEGAAPLKREENLARGWRSGNPPPAHFCTRGRWKTQKQQQNAIAVDLRLALACEGRLRGA